MMQVSFSTLERDLEQRRDKTSKAGLARSKLAQNAIRLETF